MNSLVELISKIGIFMLAGQAVIHFAPGEKYGKYMKLIVGLMILIQFLSPIYKLMGGIEIDWGEQLSNIETKLDGGVLNDGTMQVNSLNESIIAGMEKEIKSKLNNEISGEGYSVIKVDVDINASNELNMVRIVLRVHDEYENFTSGSNAVKIDKVSIQKITTDEESEQSDKSDKISSQNASYDNQNINDRLREKFCNVLGIEEEYMEVSIYGAVE